MTSLSAGRALPGTSRSAVPRAASVRTSSCAALRPSVLATFGVGDVVLRRVRGDVACDAHAKHMPKAGLLKDAEDKDACGVGFVGELSKQPTRKCITDALRMLHRMSHRGACGCEENTGARRTSLHPA